MAEPRSASRHPVSRRPASRRSSCYLSARAAPLATGCKVLTYHARPLYIFYTKLLGKYAERYMNDFMAHG